jgi:GntR family transcriptional regulator
MIDHDGDIPVYVQLAAILRGQIESGQIPPRRPIPSKKTLTQDYGVSQGTVERALEVLRAEGLIRTVMGRGMYVVPEDQRG